MHACRYRAALQLDPNHPAALLGLAEAALAGGRASARAGALGTAADELAEGAAAARRAAAAHGNLVTAWKLAGDCHIQFAAIPPPATSSGPGGGAVATGAGRPAALAAPAAGGAPPSAAPSAAAAAKRSVPAQLSEVARARRCYAAALHLNPWCGPLWGDLARCCGSEASLQRLVPGTPPERVSALLATAELFARGGLRLAPADSWLWACLGGVASTPAVQEYAWSR